MQAPTPKTRQAPTQIAKDTFLVHDHSGEGQAPVLVPLNSMVIRGAEPVVVDTGMPDNRESFLADVFGLVEPEDVRWVFLSHDDIDHVGNVHELMDACPNATLIVNWFMTERMGCTLAVHPGRWRWIGDGESFDAGDRTLHAVRPPVYDAPTTRGLFDPTTGVYWGSDSFAAPMLTPVPNVDVLDNAFWAGGFAMFHQYISPWFDIVDDAKYQRTVDRIEALGISVAAGCHSPAITGEHVGQAIDLLRTFPKMSVPDEPGQAVLEEMLAAIAAAG